MGGSDSGHCEVLTAGSKDCQCGHRVVDRHSGQAAAEECGRHGVSQSTSGHAK